MWCLRGRFFLYPPVVAGSRTFSSADQVHAIVEAWSLTERTSSATLFHVDTQKMVIIKSFPIWLRAFFVSLLCALISFIFWKVIASKSITAIVCCDGKMCVMAKCPRESSFPLKCFNEFKWLSWSRRKKNTLCLPCFSYENCSKNNSSRNTVKYFHLLRNSSSSEVVFRYSKKQTKKIVFNCMSLCSRRTHKRYLHVRIIYINGRYSGKDSIRDAGTDALDKRKPLNS